MHDLLFNNFTNSTVIDCEKGIDNQDEDPILTKITFSLLEKVNEDIINNNARTLKKVKEVFYDDYKNAMTIGRFLDGKMLSHKFLKSFFDEKRYDDTLCEIYRGEEKAKNDMAQFVLAHLESLHGMQRLFILVAWDICSNILNHSDFIGNVFCIDNLDNVDSDKIRVFLKYYTQFWVNLINSFSELNLEKWHINANELIENYAFILVLRETTYAMLTEHFNGTEKGIVEEIDVGPIYSDCNVFKNRSIFLEKHCQIVPQTLLDETCQINTILNDKYVWKNLLSLYNNDNNTAIKTLCLIQNKFSRVMSDYISVKDSMKTDIRGSYGIVLYSLLNHFQDKEYFNDYLMLYNFKRPTENQCYRYSVTRLLLTYLSNCSEPVSMYQIFRYFENIVKPEDVANTFYKIYQLRFSDWRHLITFTEAPPIDYKWIGVQINLFENVQETNEDKYAKVQITDAGKAYLKTVVPHFEFFSVRIENDLPLFCSNIFDVNSDIQKYNSIIDRVYNSVKDCNKRILDTVNETCKIKGWDYKKYIDSKFMYTNPTSGKKQFHGERVIFTHIGYINTFRKYVISREDIPADVRASHNKIIAQLIKKYLILYYSDDCLKTGRNDKVVKELWNQTLNVIEDSSDFSLPIELDYED